MQVEFFGRRQWRTCQALVKAIIEYIGGSRTPSAATPNWTTSHVSTTNQPAAATAA